MKWLSVFPGLVGLIFASCATGVPEIEVADLYFKLGSAYFDLAQYDNAVSAYSQALDLDSTLVKAGYNLAHVYLETGRLEEAKRMLESLMADEPDNTILLSTLAWATYREGDLEGALALYEQVRDKLEGDPDTLFNAATLLWELERYEEALSGFLELYELDQSSEYLSVISELYAATGDADKAIVYLERFIVERPAPSAEKISLAILYEDVRDYGKSVAMFDEIIEESEEVDPQVHFDRARILLVYIEDYIGGVEGIEAALTGGYSDRSAIDQLTELLPTAVSDEIIALANRLGLSADVPVPEGVSTE